MWCLAGADACTGSPCSGANLAGNSIVLRVVYSSLSAKAGTKADITDTLCGILDATARNNTITCYKEAVYNPAAQCATDGGGWLPNSTFVEASAATDGLVGLCQFAASGLRLTGPGSGIVARDGVSSPAAP
jgi:hypothetical protein